MNTLTALGQLKNDIDHKLKQLIPVISQKDDKFNQGYLIALLETRRLVRALHSKEQLQIEKELMADWPDWENEPTATYKDDLIN